MKPDELVAQRALVAAYLERVPRSSVQIIGYARTARPLFARWLKASHAATRFDHELRALPPRNGSNLDAALTEAATWLARVKGTRRVILISDEMLADRLTAEADLQALAKRLPGDTLIHVVAPGQFKNTLERYDESVLAPLAAATQGVAFYGTYSDPDPIGVTKLVRPVSLDNLEIAGPGWTRIDDAHTCDTFLVESGSCVWWGQGSAASGPIAITGDLWNRQVTRIVGPDPSIGRQLARMLTVLRILDEPLQAEADRAAYVVNAVWSLFALWGGSEGYADIEQFGTIGTNSIGSRSGHAFGHAIGASTQPPLELRSQLQPAVMRCGATRGLAITVETTYEEIVDVRIETRDPDMRSCVEEAVWDTMLKIPSAPAHATTRVAFEPAS
jgi:hypothetical protein